MKVTKVLLCILILAFGLSAWAQEQPRVEVSVDYSFVRFNPSTFAQAHNLNGGGGSVTFNVNNWLGFKAELFGYGSSTSHFIIPAGNPILPAGGNFAVSGNMFTYLFGPQLKYRGKKFQPFGHALFGGAYSNTYANLFQQAGVVGATADKNAFAMAFGGGIDIPITKTIAIRPVQVDYLMTRFGNVLNINNQHNFRYAAGITFYLGNK